MDNSLTIITKYDQSGKWWAQVFKNWKQSIATDRSHFESCIRIRATFTLNVLPALAMEELIVLESDQCFRMMGRRDSQTILQSVS